MSEFRYSEAERCVPCSMRVIFPTKADADTLVRHSGGRLEAARCPASQGWHLSYPAPVEAAEE